MIFLASLIFAMLFWPLEPWLIVLAQMLPLPHLLGLIALNLCGYGLLVLVIRILARVYGDFGAAKHRVSGVRLQEWLDVNGCRWLNVVGFVGVSAGAAAVLIAGQLPAPFWFLYVAVIAGLADVFHGLRLIQLPGELPRPRFDLDKAVPVHEEGGREVEFNWKPWSVDLPEDLSAKFTFENEAYEQAPLCCLCNDRAECHGGRRRSRL